MPESPINADTVNKSIDIIDESTKEILHSIFSL